MSLWSQPYCWMDKRKSEIFLYYKCVDHPSINIPEETMHRKFEELLKKITLQKHLVNLLNSSVLSLSDELLNDENKKHKEKTRQLRHLKEKTIKLDQKFIADQISVSVYHRCREEFKTEKNLIESMSNNLLLDKGYIENVLKVFKSGRFNFYKLYRRSDTLQKHFLVKMIFKDYLTWDQGVFTSCYFNELLQNNLKKAGIKKLLVIKSTNEMLSNGCNRKTNVTQIRRALRKPTLKEIEINAIEDCNFIGSIRKIMCEILKFNSKNEQKCSKVEA